MATFNKFESFAQHLAEGVHTFSTAGSLLRVYLTNNTPSASGDTVVTDLVSIATGNGYDAVAGLDISNTGAAASGIYTVNASDVSWVASGGAIADFRYVVLYDDTPTDPVDPLIGWWDYGSVVTVSSGEKFTVDFDGTSVFTIG